MAHARSDRAGPELAAPAADGKWSDFGVRLASAAILAPVALLALWHGGLAWLLVIGTAMAGLGIEWAGLAQRRDARWVLLGCLLAVVSAAAGIGWAPGLAVLTMITMVLAWRYGWFFAAGLPYAGLAGLSLLWLRLHGAGGLQETTFLIAVVWATDIGAYLVGRVAGGARLAPRISPGKTWSGAIGGVSAAAAAGLALAGAGSVGIHVFCLVAALLLSVAAQSGDLIESAIKRRLGVKDSGHTIPGHGGLFDRLDGFLTAAPLAVLIVLALGGGSLPW